MLLKEIMTRNPDTVTPDMLVQEAAEKMRELNVGALPVLDGQRLVGILTDRDITVRSTAESLDPVTARVRDTMSSYPIYAYEDQDVREGAALMEKHQIRRLPILNRAQELVGIVSLGDLAVDIGNLNLSGEVLEQVSEPAKPER